MTDVTVPTPAAAVSSPQFATIGNDGKSIVVGSPLTPAVKAVFEANPAFASFLKGVAKTAALSTRNRMTQADGVNAGLIIQDVTSGAVYLQAQMSHTDFTEGCLTLATMLPEASYIARTRADISSSNTEEKASVTLQFTADHRLTVSRVPELVKEHTVTNDLTGEQTTELINPYGFKLSIVPNAWQSLSQLSKNITADDVSGF